MSFLLYNIIAFIEGIEERSSQRAKKLLCSANRRMGGVTAMQIHLGDRLKAGKPCWGVQVCTPKSNINDR